MKIQKNARNGNDAEQALARNEGAQTGRRELWMALACFIAAGIWSLFVGGWIRLGRRIWSALRSWRDSRANHVRAGRYWFSNELNA